MTPNLTFSRHDAGSADDVLNTVIVPVYEASHDDVGDNAFYTTERFAERVRGYFKSPGFEIVIAYIDGIAVGQAFGYVLPPNPAWWTALTTEVPEGFTDEDGSRTFAFNELMVVPEWRGQGVAHALHDELLNRPQERATLLVREDNDSAQRAYARWGWRKVGKAQPYPDSPHFDALIINLPAGR